MKELFNTTPEELYELILTINECSTNNIYYFLIEKCQNKERAFLDFIIEKSIKENIDSLANCAKDILKYIDTYEKSDKNSFVLVELCNRLNVFDAYPYEFSEECSIIPNESNELAKKNNLRLIAEFILHNVEVGNLFYTDYLQLIEDIS